MRFAFVITSSLTGGEAVHPNFFFRLCERVLERGNPFGSEKSWTATSPHGNESSRGVGTEEWTASSRTSRGVGTGRDRPLRPIGIVLAGSLPLRVRQLTRNNSGEK